MGKRTKIFFAVLISIGLGIAVYASSGGAPIEFPKRHTAPSTPVPAPDAPVPDQAQGTGQATPQMSRPNVQQKTPDDVKRERALIAKKKAQLDNTSWKITMVPISGKGKNVEDTIVFSGGRITTENLGKEGFVPTNFTVSIQEEGKVIWETMQSKDEEVVFFKGELSEDFEHMGGVASYQKLEGPENYSFSSTQKKTLTPPAVEE